LKVSDDGERTNKMNSYYKPINNEKYQCRNEEESER